MHPVKTDIDIVFCIDATGSLRNADENGPSFLDDWKQGIRNIHNKFTRAMCRRGELIRKLRVRIVVFRDYIADREHAMMVTDFFQLPQQASKFEACVDSIQADGGGDMPEGGLEALTYAMKSKWSNSEETRHRHIIVMLTDADAHNLDFGSCSPFYPKGMPSDMGELSNWWDDPAVIRQDTKRLILVAPNEGTWKYISDNWYLTWHLPSVSEKGLTELSYSQVIHYITQSL